MNKPGEIQSILEKIHKVQSEEGINGRDALQLFYDLSRAYENENSLLNAEQTLLQRYDICMDTFEKGYSTKAHYQTLGSMKSLSAFYVRNASQPGVDRERFKNDSELWLKGSVELAKTHLVSFHEALTSCQYELAQFYRRHNRLSEAEALYKQVYECKMNHFQQENHECCVDAMEALIEFYESCGMYEQYQEWKRKRSAIVYIIRWD